MDTKTILGGTVEAALKVFSDQFWHCSNPVWNLFKTCSKPAPKLLKTCSKPVHDMQRGLYFFPQACFKSWISRNHRNNNEQLLKTSQQTSMRKRVGVEGCINFARLNLLTGCSRESDTRFEEVYLHADVDFLVLEPCGAIQLEIHEKHD